MFAAYSSKQFVWNINSTDKESGIKTNMQG